MKLLGIEHTRREVGYLCLVLLLIIAFFIAIWAGQQDLKEYKTALIECENNFNLKESGAYGQYGEPLANVSAWNMTLPNTQ